MPPTDVPVSVYSTPPTTAEDFGVGFSEVAAGEIHHERRWDARDFVHRTCLSPPHDYPRQSELSGELLVLNQLAPSISDQGQALLGGQVAGVVVASRTASPSIPSGRCTRRTYRVWRSTRVAFADASPYAARLQSRPFAGWLQIGEDAFHREYRFPCGRLLKPCAAFVDGHMTYLIEVGAGL